ncbi:MAG TPA: DUF692 family protein [Candidatus Saccharimonadales bacterium]|nr:DUF692 family protein [Candidatus Saccharimonadales bacterium]
MNDRFGIGWRPELAAGILSNLDHIDIVEVIADDYFDAPRPKRRALRTLAAQVPVALHGVTHGLASSIAIDSKRLEQTARLVNEIQPECWSEHLAFVRAGGLEIGHLAAPPRTEATVEGAARNLTAAKKIVGAMPLVENVTTLIDPPASKLSEADWTSEILAAANSALLLDLHNLYANSVNFGFDPYAFINRMPHEKIRAIHLAGGRWIKAKTTDERRLLDDHLHDVPDPVYELLKYVGQRTFRPLTVILERDGRYPPIDMLLNQLDRARDALRGGRAKQLSETA